MLKSHTIIEWDNTYSVGVKIIDDQHHKLVDFINDYGRDLREGLGYKNIMIIFQELVAYVKFHFKTEEDLMIKYQFPGYEKHKVNHGAFTAELAKFIKRNMEGEKLIGHDIHKYLREWLVDHILDHSKIADKEFALFLNSKGVH